MPPEPITDFSPLDSEGLQENRPGYLRKWSTLTNVIFKDGKLRPRPGLREPYDIRDKHLPSVARGVPLAIMEIHNPGSNKAARNGPTFAAETVTPNANADGVAGWAGAYTDIDETAPDSGSTKMTTSTDNARTLISFTNLSNTPELIPGVIILARVRAAYRAQRAVFNFYWGTSTTYLVHTATISGNTSDEQDDWVTIAFEVTKDPVNGQPLTKSDIDSMVIGVEYAGATSYIYEAVTPNADGTYTDWVNADDATTAAVADYKGQINLPWEDKTELDGIKPTAVDTLTGTITGQSFTFAANFNSTFNSVTQISFWIWGRVYNRARMRLFFRTGGTNYTISDFTVQGWGGSTVFQTSVDSTENPATSSAWTQAVLQSGEFGIQYLDGPSVPTVKGLFGYIAGLGSGSSVELDWMQGHVMEASGDTLSGVLGKTKIWVTDKFMARLTNEYLGTITDITNSVALGDPPNAPLDWATLYGQVYVVNGDDATRRYPNSSNLFEALTTNNADGSTILTGRTVASFADRILYGWVEDNGSVIPERIAYSKRYDGGTHNDASAGDFDLIGSAGGVVKLLPLSEDVCVAYKEQGIYSIRQSGSDVAPLIPDLIDGFTGCLAPKTVAATLSPQGTPIHLFLGTGPNSGQNVYLFDGSTSRAVGDGIQNSLIANLNFDAVTNSFAIADPEEGLYYLFVPEGTSLFPDAGFIFHVDTGAWTRFTLPYQVTCAGVWSIIPRGTNLTYPLIPVLNARRRVMVGTLEGRLVSLDFDYAFDTRWPAGVGAPANNVPMFSYDGTGVGEDRINFTCTIETGDPRPSEHPGEQVSAYRVHLVHNIHTPVPVDVTASRNGGANYETANSYVIGDITDSDAYVHDALDTASVYSHRPRVKLTIVPGDTTVGWSPKFDIAEMWIESQPQGDDA